MRKVPGHQRRAKFAAINVATPIRAFLAGPPDDQPYGRWRRDTELNSLRHAASNSALAGMAPVGLHAGSSAAPMRALKNRPHHHQHRADVDHESGEMKRLTCASVGEFAVTKCDHGSWT